MIKKLNVKYLFLSPFCPVNVKLVLAAAATKCFIFPGIGMGSSSPPKMQEQGSLMKSSSPTDSIQPAKVEELEMVWVAWRIPGMFSFMWN